MTPQNRCRVSDTWDQMPSLFLSGPGVGPCRPDDDVSVFASRSSSSTYTRWSDSCVNIYTRRWRISELLATVTWSGLHTLQFGFHIADLNRISDVVAGECGGGRGSHLTGDDRASGPPSASRCRWAVLLTPSNLTIPRQAQPCFLCPQTYQLASWPPYDRWEDQQKPS
jgi:hypothetical protein